MSEYTRKEYEAALAIVKDYEEQIRSEEQFREYRKQNYLREKHKMQMSKALGNYFLLK